MYTVKLGGINVHIGEFFLPVCDVPSSSVILTKLEVSMHMTSRAVSCANQILHPSTYFKSTNYDH